MYIAGKRGRPTRAASLKARAAKETNNVLREVPKDVLDRDSRLKRRAELRREQSQSRKKGVNKENEGSDSEEETEGVEGESDEEDDEDEVEEDEESEEEEEGEEGESGEEDEDKNDEEDDENADKEEDKENEDNNRSGVRDLAGKGVSRRGTDMETGKSVRWSSEMDIIEVSTGKESEEDEVQLVADNDSYEEPLMDEDRGGVPGDADGKWCKFVV